MSFVSLLPVLRSLSRLRLLPRGALRFCSSSCSSLAWLPLLGIPVQSGNTEPACPPLPSSILALPSCPPAPTLAACSSFSLDPCRPPWENVVCAQFGTKSEFSLALSRGTKSSLCTGIQSTHTHRYEQSHNWLPFQPIFGRKRGLKSSRSPPPFHFTARAAQATVTSSSNDAIVIQDNVPISLN